MARRRTVVRKFTDFSHLVQTVNGEMIVGALQIVIAFQVPIDSIKDISTSLVPSFINLFTGISPIKMFCVPSTKARQVNNLVAIQFVQILNFAPNTVQVEWRFNNCRLLLVRRPRTVDTRKLACRAATWKNDQMTTFTPCSTARITEPSQRDEYPAITLSGSVFLTVKPLQADIVRARKIRRDLMTDL